MAAPPVGLRNQGNTCYCNSGLQVLRVALPPLAELAAEAKERGEPDRDTARPLLPLVLDFLEHSEDASAPKSGKGARVVDNDVRLIKDVLSSVNSSFIGRDQNDAHEFLRCLIGKLHEELNRAAGSCAETYKAIAAKKHESDSQALERWQRTLRSRDDSIIVDRFGGLRRTVVRCTHCQHRSLSFQEMLEVTVPLPGSDVPMSKKFVARNRLDLRDLIAAGSSDSTEIECFKCENCCTSGTRTVTASKEEAVVKWPQWLVLHLLRFTFDGHKVEALVECPTVIEIPPVAVPAKPHEFEDGDDDEGSGYSSPDQLMYCLVGQINHHGRRINGGHYTARVAVGGGGPLSTWYECNDDRVSIVSEVSVAAASSEPYVLIYRRLARDEALIVGSDPDKPTGGSPVAAESSKGSTKKSKKKR